MLRIVQSQRIERLFEEMLSFFADHPLGVFESRQILIPSHGVGVWLKLYLANQHGIAAQVSTDFIGAFQWELYGRLAERDPNDLSQKIQQQAPLSGSIMRWKIFAYIWQVYLSTFTSGGSQSIDPAARTALSFLLQKLMTHQVHRSSTDQQARNDAEVKSKIWVLSAQIAQVFAGYVTYRPEWLRIWGRGGLLRLSGEDKPDWLVERYAEMQTWQAWLWKTLFAETFERREAEVQQFWTTLQKDPTQAKKLPKSLTIFTVIQLPPAELMFIRQLAQYVDVTLLHYNPSQEYWADLVDSRWLKRRQSERALDAQGRETHPLLTRMGKQAREVFKLLVNLSGGEFTEQVQEVWKDAFVESTSLNQPTVLQQIQQHALDLSNVKDWDFDPQDQSLAIHACHSALRQLEVLREEIIQWLGADVAKSASRLPSDILVLVPDLNDVAPLIRAVFSSPSTRTFESDAEISVPIEITGLAAPEVEALWQAFAGRFMLLAGRLSCETLLDWLALTPVQQSYNLSVPQVTRIGELLVEAGFRRGFDGAHLAQTLSAADVDVRFTLRFALDRLILGMAMPVAMLYADTLPMTTLMRDDFELIAVMEQLYQDLNQHRGELTTQRSIAEWLSILRADLQQAFSAERDTRGWASLMQALDDMDKNTQAALIHAGSEDGFVGLPLRFVLEELQAALTASMQSSTPTGRVTFARLGTMRPLPYRVIAVLNLDTGKFPKREQKNTFDLIGAFPSVLGDRSRTEDDLGAFLDALLLASDACWLFYNGQDVQDDQPRLPAAPVQELMDFLRDHLSPMPSSSDPEQRVSPLDQFIHQRHTLLPFEQANFDPRQPLGARGVWFEVAQQLNQQTLQSDPLVWADLSTNKVQDADAEIGMINANQLIKDLTQPARYFMAAARIGRIYLEEGLSGYEPLTLNKLDEYQLRHQFQLAKQSAQPLQATQWSAALPIGAAGKAYWQKGEREQVSIEQRLQLYGGFVNPLTERLLKVALPETDILRHSERAEVQLSIRVPTDQQASMWLSQSASSGRGKHLLRFWIEHLLWQVWRKTTAQEVEQGIGQRIGVYSAQTLIAQPMAMEDALKHLQDWLYVWQLAAKRPFVLPPALVVDAFKIDKKTGEVKITALDELLQKWLTADDFNAFVPPQQNEDCALHPDWQLILQGQDPAQAFMRDFERYAEVLYAPLVEQISIADEEIGGASK
ncbi:exodeoxyribonuclease V subunit gamma [Aquirhabdus parva]|uniref:RecBCD enzyme subunit RecC n=1 Tax=Aquirhabdus parva TaxID=2283318 RepID=A0A345P8V9_9GAMM|nr:exodeoxyribonuclease V subunit gamma [Aquirhabdus parva]AXI03718.1 exonuclease V subunit gamma [Aquirhabdus parva]